jgi:ATP-dependent Lon protease
MDDILASPVEIVIENTPINPEELEKEQAILPLKNMMFLPGVPTPVNVGRSKSLKLVQEVHKRNGIIGVFCQKDASERDPGFNDLFPVGV